MSEPALTKELADRHLAKLKQRVRVLLLLEAAERAGIAPLPSPRLHAFAYLADVLSPRMGPRPVRWQNLQIRRGPSLPRLTKRTRPSCRLGPHRGEQPALR